MLLDKKILSRHYWSESPQVTSHILAGKGQMDDNHPRSNLPAVYNNVNVALVTTKCLFIGYHVIGNNQLQVLPMINSMFVR